MITQVHMGQGSWRIGLRFPPSSVWNLLDEFGHIVLIDSGTDTTGWTDSQFLAASKYTGVLLQRRRSDGGWTISGVGLETYLGEGSEIGDILEPPKTLGVNYFDGTDFATVIRALLPPSLTEGTTPGIDATGLTALYYNEHLWQTRVTAINYVLGAYAAIHDVDVEWRVDPDGTFHAGKKDLLYTTTPTQFITRRKGDGSGLLSEGGTPFSETIDARQWASRVLLQGEGGGYTLLKGEATLSDIGKTNPYKDLKGNALVREKVVSEAETPQYSDNPNNLPNARAKLHLKDAQQLGERVTIKTERWNFDPLSVRAGDMVWVYDDTDDYWQDLTNPQTYQGKTIYPVKKRVFKVTWPVDGQHDIYYRDSNGTYTNITQYVYLEQPEADIELGTAARQLARDPALLHSVLMTRGTHNSSRDNADDGVWDSDGSVTIPDQVQWANTPWGYTSWVAPTGERRIDILAEWTEPNNTSGTAITDGDRYELETRRSIEVDWSPAVIIPWGATSRLLSGLDITPDDGSWGWQFRIRAVDSSGNAGAWSAVETVYTKDTTPPSQPGVPTVAGNTLAIQVTHTLDKDGDADYTLEADIDHLNVYMSTTSAFTPSASNKVGEMKADAAMLNLGIPAIGTFPTGYTDPDTTRYVKVTAVDRAGNESTPSTETSVTAQLIDTQHITDLSVTTAKIGSLAVTDAKIADLSADKINAGTLSVDRIGSNTLGMDKIILTASLVAGQSIRSTTYIAGLSGWIVNAAGDAEFNNVTIRGTLKASTIDDTITLTGNAKFQGATLTVEYGPTNVMTANNTSTVGSTTGSEAEVFTATTHTGNLVHLVTKAIRVTDGSTWTTLSIGFQRVTDVTSQASLWFYGNYVGINISDPQYPCDIQGNLNVRGTITQNGGGLDADTVDGQHASAFALASHSHRSGSTSSSANLRFRTEETYYLVSSSWRIKQSIVPVLSTDKVPSVVPRKRRGKKPYGESGVLDLTPVWFISEADAERESERTEPFIGLIAEEVGEKFPAGFVAPVEGETYPSWDERVVVSALLAEVKRLRIDVDALKEVGR